MKNLLLGVIAAAAVTALGQGTLNFNNSPATVGGAGAPIFDVGGVVKLEGTMFLAQLYAGPDVNSLSPVGDAMTFRTGAGAGFVNTTGLNTARVVPTVKPGATAQVQVRAWNSLGGTVNSYQAAFNAGLGAHYSEIFGVKTGGDLGDGNPPVPPANLVGLQSFSLQIIPEPSILALGVLGMAGLLLRRRS